MPQERSSQRLLCHDLCTWGTKEIVVKVPAINPSSVVPCINWIQYPLDIPAKSRISLIFTMRLFQIFIALPPSAPPKKHESEGALAPSLHIPSYFSPALTPTSS